MNINAIIEFQKKDSEKIKLQRALDNSESKKIFTEMLAIVKTAQHQSATLEKNAEFLLNDYSSLKKVFDDNVNMLNKISKKEIENQSDIASTQKVIDSLNSNLSILEKKLIAHADKISHTLAEFDQAKKRYTIAKDKYKKHKELYEEKEKELLPDIAKIDEQLLMLEKDIDKSLMDKYKQKRQDKIFPIVVPLSDRSCGGCFTELPSAKLSKLKEQGYLECENCRRVIYLK